MSGNGRDDAGDILGAVVERGRFLGLFARCRWNMIIFDKCGMTKFFIIRKEKVAYMEKMDKTLEGILEYLKRKGKLTELENDILLAV